jgi:pheromone shutdown protein TraB
MDPVPLERLPLPDETKACIRVLKNPQTRGLVYLIGTSHVSNASRDDVRMLIEAVKPDVVAVEVS